MNGQWKGRGSKQRTSTIGRWSLGLLLFFLLAPNALQALESQWEWVNPLPQGNSLSAVEVTDGQWTAVGNFGTVMTSTDGSQWVSQDTPSTDDLNDVVSDGTTAVAVGDSGTILTSTNGVEWVQRSSGTTEALLAVAYGNGTFVAVGILGDHGIVLRSPNGIDWTVSFLESGIPIGLTWGDGEFIAVGLWGAILSSTDGVNWIAQDTGSYAMLHDIAWNGSLYAAVGDMGAVLTSTDATIWVTQTSGTSSTLDTIVSAGGRFMAGGSAGVILTSGDGEIWVTEDSGVSENLSGAATDGRRTLFVGGYGAMTIAEDNGAWTPLSSGPTYTISGIEWLDQQYVAVGGGTPWGFGTGLLMLSDDGVIWETADLPVSTPLYGVASDGIRLVAVGHMGAIITSTDGDTWLESEWVFPPLDIPTLRDIAWANGQFVAVGSGGEVLPSTIILTSPDGIDWTQSQVSTVGGLYSVTWNGTEFLAVGASGAILLSQDGVSWGPVDSGTTEGLSDVIWNTDRYLVVGENGTILVSENGLDWSSKESGTAASLRGIAAGTGQVRVVGTDGYIGDPGVALVSVDEGETWDVEIDRTVPSLLAATWDGSEYLVAGGGGTILRTVASAPGMADLAVTIQDVPDPVAQKSLLTYEIVLTNLGPETATDVMLESTLPKGVKLQSVTATEGQCRAARLAVSCDWSDLAPGQEITVTVQVNVRRRGTITSSVSVAAVDPDDPDESNNTATETTVVEKN